MPTKPKTKPVGGRGSLPGGRPVVGGRGTQPGGRPRIDLAIKEAEKVAKAYLAAHPVTKAPAKTPKQPPITLPNFEKWANNAIEGLSKTAIAQGFALLDKKGFLPKKKR